MHATQSHGYTIREIELLFPGAKSGREKLNVDEHRAKIKSGVN